MVKISKRFQQAVETVGQEKQSDLNRAVDMLLSTPQAKFDETVELCAHLGVDPRQSTQMVRGTVSLPHGSGKSIRVVVFTDKPGEALAAGADVAGLDELLEKIEGGWLDFDVAVATPAAMKEVRRVARVLGPRGLMPNPKAGTVTDDVAKAVNEVKAGRVEFKMDKTANIAIVIGKRSFSPEKLVENATAALDSLGKSRPAEFKGKFIRSVSISATMSPSVRLDPAVFSKY